MAQGLPSIRALWFVRKGEIRNGRLSVRFGERWEEANQKISFLYFSAYQNTQLKPVIWQESQNSLFSFVIKSLNLKGL